MGGQVFVQQQLQRLNVIVKAGVIVKLTTGETAGEIIRLQPYHVVLPGFIDLHTHLRHPGSYKTITLTTELTAALRGGYNAVCCMANTEPPLDNRTAITNLQTDLQQLQLPVRVNVWSALTKNLHDQALVDVKKLQTTVVGFSDDGHSNENRALWAQTLVTVNSLVGTHCEARSSLWSSAAALSCFYQQPLALQQLEPEVRTLNWQLRQWVRARAKPHLHVHHVSTAATVQLIAKVKQHHKQLTCEVTPHHLLLDRNLNQFKNGLYRVNPPIRSFSDRQALIFGLQTGVIDCIATDHAPHPPAFKQQSFATKRPGFSGLETMFAVIYTYLVQPGLISWNTAVRATAIRPATIIRRHQAVIQVGHPANLVVIDVQTARQVNSRRFASASYSSPFENWWLTGWPVYNIIQGRLYALTR